MELTARAGERTSEVCVCGGGGETMFQGAHIGDPPLKTEKSSDLTNCFSKRAKFSNHQYRFVASKYVPTNTFSTSMQIFRNIPGFRSLTQVLFKNV